MTTLIATTNICGNVLCGDNYNTFTLKCTLCCNKDTTIYKQWSVFVKHIKQKHSVIEDIKEETEPDNEQETDYKYNIDNYHKNEDLLEIENEKNTNVEVSTELLYPKTEFISLDDTPDIDNVNKTTINQNYQDDTLIDLLENEAELLKKFYFNLDDENEKKISLKFLKLLRENPLLWNTNHSEYKKKNLRVKKLNDLKSKFRQFGYTISDGNFNRIVRHLQREYNRAKEEINTKNVAADNVKLFVESCKFFDQIKEANTGKLNESDGDLDLVDEANIQEITNDVSSVSDDDDFDKEDDIDYTPTDTLTTDPETAKCILKNPKCRYVRIKFHASKNKIATELIKLIRENPILWDLNHPNHTNNEAREIVMSEWIPIFEQRHKINLTRKDLERNVNALRSYYNKICHRTKLQKGAQDFLEQCSFLPKPALKKRIKCEHCESFCMTELNYKAHLYASHNIGDPPFKCDICDRICKTQPQLTSHMNLTHIKDFKFPCPHCKLKFMYKNSLDWHLSVHTGEKKFICETCGKSFRRKMNLNLHETRIHKRLRNFACHLCPKAFYTKALLQDHVNVHLNIRNNICPYCGKGFHSCHALMRHKQIHSVEKRYACKLCNARFSQFVGLNSHMKTKHKFVDAKKDEKEDDDDDEEMTEVQNVVPVTTIETNPPIVTGINYIITLD